MFRVLAAFAAVAAEWCDYHLTVITAAPEDAAGSTLAELGRAAQAFDRIVICQSCKAGTVSGDSAANFARAEPAGRK